MLAAWFGRESFDVACHRFSEDLEMIDPFIPDHAIEDGAKGGLLARPRACPPGDFEILLLCSRRLGQQARPQTRT